MGLWRNSREHLDMELNLMKGGKVYKQEILGVWNIHGAYQTLQWAKTVWLRTGYHYKFEILVSFWLKTRATTAKHNDLFCTLGPCSFLEVLLGSVHNEVQSILSWIGFPSLVKRSRIQIEDKRTRSRIVADSIESRSDRWVCLIYLQRGSFTIKRNGRVHVCYEQTYQDCRT